jgi:predicted adenylyl cyclase CyaB
VGKEIEIRNKLFNEKQVVDFLNKQGIKAFKSNHQIDTYYDNPNDSFFKDPDHVNDWIRIREENGKLTFNYKHWLPEGAEIRTYCDETEFEMKSKKDLNDILQKLNFDTNFIPFIVVDKFRQSFMCKGCEISIDKVKNLGDYIEIEYKGTNENVEEVHTLLNSVLKEISADVGPADHKGYAYHIFKKLKFEKSCGAVVFHKFEDDYKVLVLNFQHKELNFRGFPKGHLEEGETEIETATREIKEESGLDVKIIPEFKATTKFSPEKGTIIEAVYFAAESNKTEIAPGKDEKEAALGGKWCDFNEVKNLLTFDCDKDVFEKFIDFFEEVKHEFSKK